MILTLELSKLTHSLLNRKMPTPKPSKYLKDSPGVPCHTQIRNCCSKHTRDNKHHCPKRDFPSAFGDFYRKPPKSPSFIRHISIQSSSFGSSSSSTSSRYSCSSVIPNFPVWSLLRIPAEPSIPTLLHQDSSAGTLGLHWGKALRFQTENATTSKIFLVFFFPPGIWALQTSFCRVSSGSRQNKQPSNPVRWLAHSEGMWHLLGIKLALGCIWGRHCRLPAKPWNHDDIQLPLSKAPEARQRRKTSLFRCMATLWMIGTPRKGEYLWRHSHQPLQTAHEEQLLPFTRNPNSFHRDTRKGKLHYHFSNMQQTFTDKIYASESCRIVPSSSSAHWNVPLWPFFHWPHTCGTISALSGCTELLHRLTQLQPSVIWFLALKDSHPHMFSIHQGMRAASTGKWGCCKFPSGFPHR